MFEIPAVCFTRRNLAPPASDFSHPSLLAPADSPGHVAPLTNLVTQPQARDGECSHCFFTYSLECFPTSFLAVVACGVGKIPLGAIEEEIRFDDLVHAPGCYLPGAVYETTE